MKPLRNEHTGHLLKTKVQNDKYSDGWDAIFGKKQKKCDECGEGDAVVSVCPFDSEIYHQDNICNCCDDCRLNCADDI